MLSNLQRLGLSYNNLGGRIPSALSGLLQLQVLSLENNNFTSVPSELALLRNIYFMDITGNLEGVTSIVSEACRRRLPFP